jgi:hypothetical protein
VFFLWIRVFFILTNDYITHRFYIGLEWALTTTTGPKDARRVLWALGMCFSLNNRVFHILTLLLSFI